MKRENFIPPPNGAARRLAENTPEELRRENRWAGFRSIRNPRALKPRKIPVIIGQPDKYASSTDPATWRTFSDAIAGLERREFTVAAYALAGDGVILIDVDECINGGSPNALASSVMKLCPTYTEVSISGAGLHLVARMPVPRGRMVPGVEVYPDKRLMTMTGNRLWGTPAEIHDFDQAITQRLLSLVPEDAEVISSASSVSSAYSGTVSLHDVDEAIGRCIPKKVGDRNACLFNLARLLKFNLGYEGRKITDIRPLVEQWHKRALPVIGTKPFVDSWADFTRAWRDAKLPMDARMLEEIYSKVRKQPLPSEAVNYDRDEVKWLLGLCWELSKLTTTGRFFLSCHCAGDLLGVDSRQASRWLNMFEVDGVIVREETGNEYRANRYRWLNKAPTPNTGPSEGGEVGG